MDLQKPKEKILILLIPFLIISLFSFNPNPHIDEAVSLYCSKFYFEDCIDWDVQFPTFYFWLNFLELLFFKIEYLRVFLAFFSAFSIYLIIKSINLFIKFSFKYKLVFSILLSFIPLFYSSTLLRPYIFSLLFASLSVYYLLKYIKTKNYFFFKKSLFFDFFAATFFVFNISVLLLKLIFLPRNKAKDFFVMATAFAIILAPFFYILLYNANLKLHTISWYRNVEEYKFFWFNFPIDIFKNLAFEESEKHILGLIFAKLAQLIFFLPIFFSEEKMRIFYLFLLLSIVLISLLFSLKGIYLTLSRHFVFFAVFLLVITLITLPKIYVVSLLVLYFAFQTSFIIENLLNNSLYGNWTQAYNNIPHNSSVFVYPFHFSSIFWYFEKIYNKNLTIIDTLDNNWFQKNLKDVSFRKWQLDKPIIKYYKVENLSDKIKIFVDIIPINCEIKNEFISNFHKIYICY